MASKWVTSVDGESSVNVTALKEIRVARLPVNNTQALAPDAGASAPLWGIFATVEEGRQVQIGTATYATKAAAIADIATQTATS